MAPNKGRFVEDVATENSDFASASKGQVSNKSLGSLFSSAGSLIGDAIKVADNQFQQSVQNKVDDFYANEQKDLDPAIMELSSEGVPTEITKGTENIIKMSKAMGNGLISDTQFFMRAAALSKRLKDQYPGHKEYVDRAIGQARGTSANMVRSKLLSELDSLATASQKSEQDKLKEGYKAVSEGWIIQEEIDRYGIDAALNKARAAEGNHKHGLRQIQSIKDRVAMKDMSIAEAAREFELKALSALVMTPMGNVLRKAFPNAGATDVFGIGAYIAGLKGTEMSGKEHESLVAGFRELRTTIMMNVQNAAKEAEIAGPELTAILQRTRDQLQFLDEAITNKDWGVTGSVLQGMQIAEGVDVNSSINLLEGRPIMLMRKANIEMFGAGSNETLMLNEAAFKNYGSKVAAQEANFMANQIIHSNAPISKQMDLVANNKLMTPKDKAFAHKSFFDAANAVLKTLPPDHPKFLEVAKATFKDNPEEVLKHWEDQSARQQVFNAYINPEVQAKLLASPYASDYALWAKSAFTSIISQETGDLNRAIEQQNTGLFFKGERVNTITFDMKSFRFQNEFDARANDLRGIKSMLVGAPYRPKVEDEIVHRQATASVMKLNSMLERLQPIMDMDGDRVKATSQLLQQMGVSIDRTTGAMKFRNDNPVVYSLAESVANWVKETASEAAEKAVPILKKELDAYKNYDIRDNALGGIFKKPESGTTDGN